ALEHDKKTADRLIKYAENCTRLWEEIQRPVPTHMSRKASMSHQGAVTQGYHAIQQEAFSRGLGSSFVEPKFKPGDRVRILYLHEGEPDGRVVRWDEREKKYAVNNGGTWNWLADDSELELIQEPADSARLDCRPGENVRVVGLGEQLEAQTLELV